MGEGVEKAVKAGLSGEDKDIEEDGSTDTESRGGIESRVEIVKSEREIRSFKFKGWPG